MGTHVIDIVSEMRETDPRVTVRVTLAVRFSMLATAVMAPAAALQQREQAISDAES